MTLFNQTFVSGHERSGRGVAQGTRTAAGAPTISRHQQVALRKIAGTSIETRI